MIQRELQSKIEELSGKFPLNYCGLKANGGGTKYPALFTFSLK